jgi:hypothetical protein
MELLWTLLLALPTIFVAAFLAATLESFRERLRTRRWVMRNLREFTDTGRFDSASHLTAAFRRWLDGESADLPLTGVDRRRVEWFLRFLTTFLAVRDRAQSSFERFRDAVRAA